MSKIRLLGKSSAIPISDGGGGGVAKVSSGSPFSRQSTVAGRPLPLSPYRYLLKLKNWLALGIPPGPRCGLYEYDPGNRQEKMLRAGHSEAHVDGHTCGSVVVDFRPKSPLRRPRVRSALPCHGVATH